MNLIHAAAVSVIMLAVYFVMIANTGRMRRKKAVPAPAVTGDPAFERAYRVQMNTLEHLAVALPSLWIYAAFGSARWPAVAGAIWISGRVIYAVQYIRDPQSRAPGMMLTLAGEIWLLGGAIWAVGRALWIV